MRTIIKKPFLISRDELTSIGNDINIVGSNSNLEVDLVTNKYSSPNLLNYVEPYNINGVKKTLFYTEVNTNIKVGNRVFIINGNYDSNSLIKVDKYKKGSDGYKVLYVDNCKIVLDIDYNGILPNSGNLQNNDNMSDYIKIYYIDSEQSFLSANRQLTTRNGNLDYKYNKNQNVIAYIDKDYGIPHSDWGYNNGVTGTPGFFVKNGTQSWINITNDFISGSYSQSLSNNYHNNGKLKVMGKTFDYNNHEFKNGFVYKWITSSNTWEVEIEEESIYTKAIISKSNFIDGNFKGKFNSGVYGSKFKKITWNGDGTWNGGTLLNTLWLNGDMNSKILLPVSYKSNIDGYGLPLQKINTINNGGYGFNYIIESEFILSNIYSGIMRNVKVGFTSSEVPSVVENHLLSLTQSYLSTLTNVAFEYCDLSNIEVIGGVVKNSTSINSKMFNTKLINSEFIDTVIKDSTYISDSIIKVDGYDEWNASERRTPTSGSFSTIQKANFKVYKFYIGESDFLRLVEGDTFYIKGLKIKDSSKDILNFFDKKFKINSSNEYIDDRFKKVGIECAAFLSTPEENEWVYNTISVTGSQPDNNKVYTEAIRPNLNPRYSIDIFVSLQDNNNLDINNLNFNYDSDYKNNSSLSLSTYLGDKIDISQAYIIDSNFESGIMETSDWNSGYNINYNNDLTIKPILNSNNENVYDILIDSDTLKVSTLYNKDYPENYDLIKKDDILFLNNLEYDTRGKVLGFTLSPLSSSNSYLQHSGTNSLSTTYSTNKMNGRDLTFNTNTNLSELTILNRGLEYKVGDTLKLIGSINDSNDAIITITEVDNGLVKLIDSYKVSEFDVESGVISLIELSTDTTSVVRGLTSGGEFKTTDARNRWMYISKTKISNTNIKSGLFKRSNISKSIILDESYDVSDKDFNNLTKIKNLVLSDMTFKNTDNLLSKATYINSIFIGGSDTWDDGIIYNSRLNNIEFNKGVIKESSWLDGIFNGGIFYSSRSFNGISTSDYTHYHSNKIETYYIDGLTNSNNRNSWRNGTFSGGEFFKSDWENGSFNSGSFYNSKFYNGSINGGIIGNLNTLTSDTIIYNGVINYTTVDNAMVYSTDTSYTGETSSITWNDGIFNKGIFGSADNIVYGPTSSSAIGSSSSININSVTNSTYLLYKSISKTFSVSSQFLGTNEIRLNIKLNCTNLSNISIDLKSPNGEILNIKNFSIKTIEEFDDELVFSTNQKYLDLSISNYPYSNIYRSSNTNSISNTVNTYTNISNITGVWEIIILQNTETNETFISSGFILEFIENDQIVLKNSNNSSTWNNGVFNNGEFVDMAVWKNGIFNGGKFTSGYGWTVSGSYSIPGTTSSHSWQDGEFNNGEFGNGLLNSNSTWNNGVFNNGVFKGRVWNNGIFKYGEFIGSGSTYSAIGGIESSNAKEFVNSFSQSFYGLWRDGIVTDRRDLFTIDKKVYGDVVRGVDIDNNNLSAKIKDIIWLDGIFEHPDGELTNSVWLNGYFKLGNFNFSTFNPYVNRIGSGITFSSNFQNGAPRSRWINGIFNESEFHISNWDNGSFISGTAYGMIFNNGVSNYMNAYNVFWENGTWKNGNWNGSYFNYDGVINSDYEKLILNNGFNNNNNNNNDNNIHLWNIFEDSSDVNLIITSNTSSTIGYSVDNVNPSTASNIFPKIRI